MGGVQRPARLAAGGAPPARPSDPSAGGTHRRRGRALGACARSGGASSSTLMSASRAVTGVMMPEPSTMSGQRRIDGVRLGVLVDVPVEPLPDADEAPRVRSQDQVARGDHPVLEAVPARVDRIQRDELNSPSERPVRDQGARKARLAHSAASVDQDDRIRGGQPHDGLAKGGRRPSEGGREGIGLRAATS